MLHLSILMAVLGLGGGALAQSYPSRPVHILIPFAAGGSLDVLARMLGPKMADDLGQPVIVDNRPGAGGRIAPAVVAKSSPDGYTILLSANALAIMPALYLKLPFDPVTDFAPITQLIASETILVGSPKLEIRSITDFIAAARARPGQLNHGSTGVASQMHLTMEMIKSSTGVDVVQIPYKGDAPILAALMSGEVSVAVMPVPTTVVHIKSGRVRPLAATGARRLASLPDVPTLIESGLTTVDMSGWMGLFAPALTPGNVLSRVQQAAAKALAAAEVRDRLPAFEQTPIGSTPQEFEAKFKADIATFRRVVAAARIPPQD